MWLLGQSCAGPGVGFAEPCGSLSIGGIPWFHDSVKAALAAASSLPVLGLSSCGRVVVSLWVPVQVQEAVGYL